MDKIILTSQFAGKSESVTVSALAAITNLKKLCNHPDLVYEKITEKSDGFENAAKFMPDDYNKKYGTLHREKRLVNLLFLILDTFFSVL